jgi:hypothetical protein
MRKTKKRLPLLRQPPYYNETGINYTKKLVICPINN